MPRYIDATKLEGLCDIMAEKCDGVGESIWHQFRTVVEMSPTADVVEVVMCKDCKWFNDYGCAIRIVDDSDKPKDNDFCSFGERKETEDEQ